MKSGHGRLITAVMAAVMATLACSVEWQGVEYSPNSLPAAPSMTGTASPTLSMTDTPPVDSCLVVESLPNDGGALNLRTGPGVEYPVLAVLHDGQTLVMDNRQGDWYAVMAVMDGRSLSGFVHSSYVEVCDESN